jgi:hypothetical protein
MHAIYLIDAGTGGESAQAGSYTSLTALIAAKGVSALNDCTIYFVANGTIYENSTTVLAYNNGVIFESWPQNTTMPLIQFNSGAALGIYINSTCNNLTFRGLRFYQSNPGICLGAYYAFGRYDNLTIDSCYIECITGSALYFGMTGNVPVNMKITNNVIKTGGQSVLNSNGGIIANNTFIAQPGHAAVGMVSTQAMCPFYNNIMYGNGVSGYLANYHWARQVNVSDYNSYYNGIRYYWFVPGPNDTLTVNPLFVDFAGGDYKIQATSPCVDTGVSPVFNPLIPTSDFLKKARGDGNGLWDKGAYEYAIANYVQIISAPSVETYEDQEYTYYPIADYLGETGVQWSLSGEPTGMTLDASTGVTGAISWTPTTGGYSTDAITLSITDGVVSADQSWQVNVLEVNDRPIITSIPSEYVQYGSTYFYQASAMDEETSVENLKWRLIGAPEGMNVEETTGLVTWNPTTPGVATSIITLEVRDEGDLTDIQQWTVTVMPIVVGQKFVEAESNSTIYITPEMVIITDLFNAIDTESHRHHHKYDEPAYTIQVLSGQGYHVIHQGRDNDHGDQDHKNPKINIGKQSVPTCIVNVTVKNRKGKISNVFPLIINTHNKNEHKNKAEPPCFFKGKNKS